MSFNGPWNPSTSEGKKNLAALLRVVGSLRYREDLQKAVREDPILKHFTFTAVQQKLQRVETDMSESSLGKAWCNVPRKQNLLFRLFPDANIREQLARDFVEIQARKELKKRYPQLRGLNEKQIERIRAYLGVIGEEIPNRTNWWRFLSEGRKKQFDIEFLGDYRNVFGLTNRMLVEKWHECGDHEGLGNAARALGESRNRIQIRSETQTADQVEKAIEQRMKMLIIQENALNTIGSDALHMQLVEEFAEKLGQAQSTFHKEQFLRMKRRVVWTEEKNGSLTVLIDMVNNRMSIKDKFLPYFPYIPLSEAEQEAQEQHGIVNIIDPVSHHGLSTTHGIGRFAGEGGFAGREDFAFPHASASEPFEIAVKDPNNWDILLGSTNLGLPHPGAVRQNPAYWLFEEAAYRNAASLIITNPVDIDTLKVTGGTSKVSRAIFSGLEENLSVMDPEYRPIAERIFREHPNDETVCTTAEERLQDLMLGFRKVSRKPKKKPGTSPDHPEYLKETKPVYNGPVYVIGGMRADDLVKAMVYAQVRYHKILLQNDLHIELKVALAELKKRKRAIGKAQAEIVLRETLEKEGASDREEEKQERHTEIQNLHAKLEKIFEEVVPLQKRVKVLADRIARERLTFVHDVEWNRFVAKATSHFASLFEGHGEEEGFIPHAKVLNLSGVYLKVGHARMKVHMPPDCRVTDMRLIDYCNSYGPAARRGEMADVTVICPTYSLNYRTTAREVDAKGKRGSAEVCVAPMCIDDQFIREKARNTVAIAHPAGKAVFSKQIGTGAVLISCRNGIVSTSFLPLASLGIHERLPKRPVKRSAIADSYIWWWIQTDEHVGARDRERFDIGAMRGLYYVREVLFQSLRACGYGPKNPPPIHFYVIADDGVHGQHFPAYRQPDQKYMLPYDFHRHIRLLEHAYQSADDPREKQEIFQRLSYFTQKQKAVSGVDWYSDQLEEFKKSLIKANADIFEGILFRFMRAGIILRPISEYERESFEQEGEEYDRRDLGVINYSTGNHGGKTTDYHFAEGPDFASYHQALLSGTPRWIGKDHLLETYIRGPLYGNLFVSYGTVQAPGGYTWGVDLRNTPPQRGTNWADPLFYAVRTQLRRGNISRIFEGKVVIHIYGDKHFYEVAITAQDIEAMGPPATRTNSFAELAGGLPPNNTGASFLGVPAEGPQAGPILCRPLLFDDIRDRIALDPKNFDWENFLPDAL
mgnify:CR=1 FL=1